MLSKLGPLGPGFTLYGASKWCWALKVFLFMAERSFDVLIIPLINVGF